MFRDWKQAWQQAVENFQRELSTDDDEPHATPQIGSMRRDLNAARTALRGLEEDIAQTRGELAQEEEAERTCLRRKEMAERIEDGETVRIAGEWALRHAQRAGILRRKAEVLQSELEMRIEELHRMDVALQEAVAAVTSAPAGGQGSVGAGPAPRPRTERARQDGEFRRLDREQRERAAEARLEELKKKMQ